MPSQRRLQKLIQIGARVGLTPAEVRAHWRTCRPFVGKKGKCVERHHILPVHLFSDDEATAIEQGRDDDANLVSVRYRDHRKIHAQYFAKFGRLEDKAVLNWRNGDEEAHLLRLKLAARKISAAKRGKKHSLEHRANISAAQLGKKRGSYNPRRLRALHRRVHLIPNGTRSLSMLSLWI